MKTRRLGIIMNGVTGRMGTNQHLVRSVLAIRQQGGVKLANEFCALNQLKMPEIRRETVANWRPEAAAAGRNRRRELSLWSPDSRSVGFFAGGALRFVARSSSANGSTAIPT